MLFKDELPPPRHTLDAGDFSDSDANVEVSHEIEFALAERVPQRVLLLAPKCATLARGIRTSPAGTITVSAVRRSTASGTAAPDFFYEYDDVDAADFTSRKSWTLPVLDGPHGLLIIIAAAVPEAEAAFVGKQLVARLRPQALYVATPGISFMREPVCCLVTPGAEPLAGVPLAAPPVIVQGVGAAALSRARQLDVPATALVVSGDGPVNHEIIDEDRLAALRHAVFAALGLPPAAGPRADRDLSTLYV